VKETHRILPLFESSSRAHKAKSNLGVAACLVSVVQGLGGRIVARAQADHKGRRAARSARTVRGFSEGPSYAVDISISHAAVQRLVQAESVQKRLASSHQLMRIALGRDLSVLLQTLQAPLLTPAGSLSIQPAHPGFMPPAGRPAFRRHSPVHLGSLEPAVRVAHALFDEVFRSHFPTQSISVGGRPWSRRITVRITATQRETPVTKW